MRYHKTTRMDPNRVEVAPYGPKLCQNVAPRLRIIFEAFLRPKTQLKKKQRMLEIPISTAQNQPLAAWKNTFLLRYYKTATRRTQAMSYVTWHIKWGLFGAVVEYVRNGGLLEPWYPLIRSTILRLGLDTQGSMASN